MNDSNPRTPEPRILSSVHVYKGFPPVRGGIEGHVDLLTRMLVEQGTRCEVICAAADGAPAREQHGAVAVHRLPVLATLASTPLTPSLPGALRKSGADIVHLHFPWPPAEAAWLLAGSARPLVITVHCEVVRYPILAQLLSPLTRRVFAAASRIIVIDPFLLDLAAVAPNRERVEVIPHGVDLDWFRPDPAASDPLPSLPHPRVLFVGRLRHYKGLPVLARALALLPGVQGVVVGDGPERESFEQIAGALGIRDRVHLLGEVDDERLRRLYQTAGVCVLPSTSRAEAYGVAMAEAQACGLPGVTTDLGTGTTQTVSDGVSGRVVAPGNPDALADAIRWCLEPQRRAALQPAARRYAEGHLDARHMAQRVEALYTEILT